MREQFKKFIPCIYLKEGKAVKGLQDPTIVSLDPVALAGSYNNGNADGLLIFDQSNTDAEHEEALDLIKEICGQVKIPVIGAGNVKRMEDVKKLLYAGCQMAALNYSKPENVAITKEVSEKFGKDRIAACYRAADAVTEHKELIAAYVEKMILIDETAIKEALAIKDIPTIISLPEVSLDKILDFFTYENIDGITGNAVNENIGELRNIKVLCRENGITVNLHEAKLAWSDFKLNSDGQLPVVVQEADTDEVLMVAYMNEEAYNLTVATGRMTYFSRSRQSLWIKGETSGHFQYVKSLTADCDRDTLLAKVDQIGPACHTGSHSCFFNEVAVYGAPENNPQKVLEQVYGTILDRREHPKEGSYTNYLFEKGIDKMLKKLGEESTEIVIAAKNPNANEIKYEMADYLYHMMVVMAEKGVTWRDITEELARRERPKEG
ncbi:MAG: bifunctional phosphoribosyl-AMP cyclohydrolase/phosphoribosyl-ATP diphosphatase HisIE [Eubacteriales bacterium]|nr:bifunctional phosphoribosyl-AMP cyclohydrolase/phosphoribosyl-ATP diphosphatase HisIE [Eubacteriales bacterium]